MWTTVNGVRLFFDVDGALLVPDAGTLRERPTILALHGGPGFDHGYLKPGLAVLADLGQVVYLDQRCQGRSTGAPVETCTLEQMADDAAAFCTAMGIRPVVLGHSAGGCVAMVMAARHPDVAAGLVLCSTAAHLHGVGTPSADVRREGGSEAVAAMASVFGGTATADVFGTFAELVAPHYLHPERRHMLPEVLPLSGVELEVSNQFWSRQAAAYDVRPALAGIAMPTLVLVGDFDWITPAAASKEIAATIPGAELVEIPGAGHFPSSERPDEFIAAVRRFLTTRIPDAAPASA